MHLTGKAGKALDKVQHPLMIKNPQQSRFRGNIPQHNEGSIQKNPQLISSMGKNSELSLYGQEQDRDVHFLHCHLT